MTEKRKILNLHHARRDDQRRKMEELLARGLCPFCPKHLEEYHDNPIEVWGKYWVITKNDYPYAGTKLHYLLIFRKHITRPEEISVVAMKEMLVMLRDFSREHEVPGGAILMRFGETDYTGATVDHLHLHIIVGGKRRSNATALTAYIGYKK